jgi:hypothetical protein
MSLLPLTFAVLGVAQKVSDEYDACVVVDRGNKAVLISLNVEYRNGSTAGNGRRIGMRIGAPHVVDTLPSSSPCFHEPLFYRLLSVSMFRPIALERGGLDHSHEYIMYPFCFSVKWCPSTPQLSPLTIAICVE